MDQPVHVLLLLLLLIWLFFSLTASLVLLHHNISIDWGKVQDKNSPSSDAYTVVPSFAFIYLVNSFLCYMSNYFKCARIGEINYKKPLHLI